MPHSGQQELLERLQDMESARREHDRLVQDAADFVNPFDAEITETKSTGVDRLEDIYDTTAINARKVNVAGMYAHNVGGDRRWFELSSSSEALKEDEDAKRYFNDITGITYNKMAESNFMMQIQSVFSDQAVVGRSVIFVLFNDLTRKLVFKVFPYVETYIAEGEDGLVNQIFRRFSLTAMQAAEKYGENNLSADVRGMLSSRRKMDKIPFIQIVLPREDRDSRFIDAVNMPWANLTFERKTKHPVMESGFNEQPFAGVRTYKPVAAGLPVVASDGRRPGIGPGAGRPIFPGAASEVP